MFCKCGNHIGIQPCIKISEFGLFEVAVLVAVLLRHAPAVAELETGSSQPHGASLMKLVRFTNWFWVMPLGNLWRRLLLLLSQLPSLILCIVFIVVFIACSLSN